jgi:4-amino-4-deoxy-L-arabinose transferase-like glycosyltransferase
MTTHPPPSRFDRFYDAMAGRIGGWSTRRFLLTVIILQIVLHLPVAPLPPLGQHTWRQVMGLATARNYFEEGHSFLYPAQDVRIGAEDRGVTYFEFPLLYWLIGQSYHLTGFSHLNGRLVMLATAILLILGVYRLSRGLGADEHRARWIVFFLSSAPYFFYYAITVSPNLPALTWFVWGLALILSRLHQERWDWVFWLGAICLAIGTLSKATYLFFGLPVAVLFFDQYRRQRHLAVLLVAVLTALIVLVPNGWIYLHSKALFEASPVERQYYAVLKPEFFPRSWEDFAATLRPAVMEWFLQMFVNTAAIPFFVVGCYQAIRQRKWATPTGRFWIAWILGFLVFSVFFFTQFRQHAYYLTPLLVLAAFTSGYGADWIRRKRTWRLLLVILVVLTPLVMVGRVGHRWTSARQIPSELLYEAHRFQAVIPPDEPVLVVGDDSPVVFLYYLHRKGVVIPADITDANLNRYRAAGFRWVVSHVPLSDLPAIYRQSPETVTEIGTFVVLRW